jgi:hypothetical protein
MNQINIKRSLKTQVKVTRSRKWKRSKQYNDELTTEDEDKQYNDELTAEDEDTQYNDELTAEEGRQTIQ